MSIFTYSRSQLFLATLAVAIIVPAGAGHAAARQAKLANSTSPLPSPAARAAATSVASFHRALKQTDLAAAAAQLSADVLIFESGGVERSRTEYVSHHLPADAAFAKATMRTVNAQSANAVGDFAWVATESRTTGTFKGRAIDNGLTETMILRREGGTWRIVHIHWSSGK
jgi:ketosteroid isomerase-like protein